MRQHNSSLRTISHNFSNKPPFVEYKIQDGITIAQNINSSTMAVCAFLQFEKFLCEKQFNNKQLFTDFMHNLRLEIENHERGFSRLEILPLLKRIRQACAESPFIKRAQNWPRGYPGDFETVDYILRSENLAKKGSFGYVVEDYFLKSPICQQHRNKVSYQSHLIRETILKKNDAKIISIGCGTSEDVSQCVYEINESMTDVTLVDVDSAAIDFSLERLSSIRRRITPITGNIYRVMRSLSHKYDLVLIGGVFDYLNDKTISAVLSSLRDNVAENGKLFFTNIAAANPFRIFMEYLSDWILIERTEHNLLNLITNAGWPKPACRITRDETGLTYLAEIRNSSADNAAVA